MNNVTGGTILRASSHVSFAEHVAISVLSGHRLVELRIDHVERLFG